MAISFRKDTSVVCGFLFQSEQMRYLNAKQARELPSRRLLDSSREPNKLGIHLEVIYTPSLARDTSTFLNVTILRYNLQKPAGEKRM